MKKPVFTPFLSSSALSLYLTVLTLSVCILTGADRAQAITIDTFEGFQQVVSSAGSNVTNRSNASTAGLGGKRALETVSNAGFAGTLTSTTTTTTPFFFQHSQDNSVEGITRIHWDGNDLPDVLDVQGLGGISLLEDGGTKFILENLFFDWAFNSDISIDIIVFDASDASGDTFSQYNVALTSIITGADIEIPFASPTSTGTGGAADLSNVGAIQLIVNGINQGVDLSFDNFVTDGSCPLSPPVGGGVLDACGDCIPPTDPSYNQACVDCLGVPNGTAVAGTSCDTGEIGPCAPGIYTSTCTCDRVYDPVVEICDGFDNNCNGEIDEIFPQVGMTCGTVQQGDCKVEGSFICDGNGGITCDIDFDNSNFDDCGIEIGCDGVPGSGLKPDECGICGGDGSTCEDLGCEANDISELLFQLDGGAKDQEALVRSITKLVRRNTRKKRILALVDVIREDTHQLQLANWIRSWTIPVITVNCLSDLAEEFCTTASNVQILEDYRAGSVALRRRGRQAARLLRKVTGDRRLAKRWRKRVNRQHLKNLDLAADVPLTQETCIVPATNT